MSLDKQPLSRPISRLKQDAKTLSKENGTTHHKELNVIAQSYGYKNWQDLTTSNTEISPKKAKPAHSVLSKPNRDLVLHNREILAKHGIDYGLLAITETGLNKSIMDAVAPLREYFILNHYHDYMQQEQGVIEKKPAKLIVDGLILDTQVSLYRPKTKKGDPRIWIYGLTPHAEANDTLALVLVLGVLCVFNISKIDLDQYLGVLSALIEQSGSVAKELLEKLRNLAIQGPIKAVRVGDTAIGMTIEHALGISANSSKNPDYKGIELKSAREKVKAQKNRSTIFAQVADWEISPLKSSGEIIDKYGYMREGDLRLYCTLSTQVANSQGLQFEYRANEDLLVETHITDGDVAYWKGSILRNRLLEKHKETFWIQAESVRIDDIEYFILKSLIHTKNPLLGQFMQLLHEGIITMDHAIKRKGGNGSPQEKGPLFKIHPKNLKLLFPEQIEYSLE